VGNILQIADAAQPVRYHHNQRVVPANDYQYDALYQLTCATGRENAGAAAQGPGLPVPQVPLSVDPNAFSTYTRRYSYDRGANLLRIRHQGAQDYTLDMLVAPTSNRAVQQTGHLTPGDVDGHFDAAGNLLQLAPGQALRWDGRNQLQRVAQVLRHNALDDAETYQYDGAGQRLRKTTLSHTRGTVRSAQVLYLPGLELRVTQREQGGTSRTVEELHVISAGGAGRQQVRVLHWEAGQPADIPNDQLRGSLDNQIGSSLLELDQQAEILTLEEYFPFGGTAVWSGKTVSETKYKFVRYSGQERDASGLYYYGFRYYAPWLGRWLNPDPAGTVDGLNLFRMVRNNPITFSDADGRMYRRGGASTKSSAASTIRSVLPRTGETPPHTARTTIRQPSSSRDATSTTARPMIARASGATATPPPSARRPFAAIRTETKKARGKTSALSTPLVPGTDLSTLDIDVTVANDDFFDPKLGTRLQKHKTENLNRFVAMQGIKHKVDGYNVRSSDTEGVVFIASYKPESWTFKIITKPPYKKYYGSDITMDQYVLAATEGGFFGNLPKEVTHDYITNELSLNVINKFRALGEDSEAFFIDFIRNTDNGKFTQRSLNVFGMEAYKVREFPQKKDVTFLVRKIQQSST
jgi:RHS repeat-associated protein